MISIIIPTLNEEKYLGRLLDSIKKQAYADYEVLVVDAGSTDNTKGAAAGFNFLSLNQPNVSMQRNFGAGKAKGDLLMFLDADVVIKDSDFLEKAAAVFSNKSIAAATCKVRILPAEERLFDRLFFAFTDFVVKTTGRGRGACQIVRKELFSCYNEKMSVGEDIDLFKRIKGKIQFMPSVVYESARRYRKEGYARIFLHWTLSWFSNSLGRPYSYKRKDVR